MSWQVLGSIVKFLARFGIGIALARLLPPEDFGIVGIAMIATGFASTLADLGLGPALIQRNDIGPRHIRVSQTISTAASLLIAVALYASAGSIADFFGDARVGPVLKVLAITFVFSGSSITAGALLARRLAFDIVVRVEIIASIVGYGAVAVTLALAGFGYWSLVWGTISQAAISAVLTYSAERNSLRPLIAKREIAELFGFSAGMSLSSTVNYFARQGDYFVVGRLMNAASLGLYTRAFTLMELPHRLLGSALSRVLFPAASRAQDDPERFRRAFLMAFSLSVALSLPVSLTVAILAPEIILVLYGERWAASIPLLQILALFGAFRMSYNTAGAFVRARGQALRILLVNVCFGVLVLAGTWWAGSKAGLEGVAWGMGVAIVGCWALMVVLAKEAASASYTNMARHFALGAAPGLGVGIAVLFFASAMRGVEISNVVVLLSSGTLATMLTLWNLIRYTRRLQHPGLIRAVGQARSFFTRAYARASLPF